MAENNSFFEYTEEAAVAFIRERLPEASDFTDDEIIEIIDWIYDYYEAEGLLDLSDVDTDTDVDALIAFVVKKARAEGARAEAVASIVRLEMDYEDSINLF